MPLEPSLVEQELLPSTFERPKSRLTRAEWASEALVSLAFAAAVAAIWLSRPPQSFGLTAAALSFLVLVLATRVPFDTPLGFTVPTQLGYVPLVFATPVALSPLAVVAALALARAPELVTGKTLPSRMIDVVGNSWFAIGPAVVFAVANVNPADAGAALLVAALVAQFLADFTVSAVRFRIARGATLSEQLGDVWVYGVDAALSGVALVVAEQMGSAPVAALAPLPLLALFAVFARERRRRLEGLLELNSAYRGTALVLADVIEADDSYTGEHSKGVVELVLELADALGLNSAQRRDAEFAALLHDVGKIAVPKEIVNKRGALTPAEWDVIKEHTIEGQRMLTQVGGYMRHVGEIVRSTHERWDGGGYPDGLAGEQIPVEARIIACADAWNAMRTDRPYRNALPPDVAVTELVGNADRQFDARVVNAFVGMLGGVPTIKDPAGRTPPEVPHEVGGVSAAPPR